MIDRRNFLLAVPLFVIACTNKTKTPEELKKLQEEAGTYSGIDKKLISEGHPIASTFMYTKDGTTASANLRKNGSLGVPPDQMLCNTCNFYTPIGNDYGSCQILPQGNVTSKGWCKSWAKKGQTADEMEKNALN